MILRKVQTVHTGVPGSPFVSTMYFTFVAGQADQTLANVLECWGDLATVMHTDLVSTVEREQVLIEDTTGAATGTELAAGPNAIGATDAFEPMPAATQGLIQLRTGTYVGGREIRGRLFVPSPCEDTGHATPSAAYQTLVNGAFQDLIVDSSTSGPWRVWSRKNLQSAVVTTANTWSQWAVLRSRRD